MSHNTGHMTSTSSNTKQIHYCNPSVLVIDRCGHGEGEEECRKEVNNKAIKAV